MINKSIKYIGVILLAYTLNACNEQRMNSSSETPTPVWLAEVGKRDVRELTTTTGTAKAAKTVEVKSETNGKYELMITLKNLIYLKSERCLNKNNILSVYILTNTAKCSKLMS